MVRRCDTCEWWSKRGKGDPDGDYTDGDCHLGTLITDAYASHWCSHHTPKATIAENRPIQVGDRVRVAIGEFAGESGNVHHRTDTAATIVLDADGSICCHPIDVLELVPGDMFATARAPGWGRLRAAWMKAHPECAVCGRKGVEASCVPHHVVPVHVDASKELDENNLITLCESGSVNCHLAFGHLWNWSRWNPHVVVDAREWQRKIKQSADRWRGRFIPHDLAGGLG